MEFGYIAWPPELVDWLQTGPLSSLVHIPSEYQPWICSLIASTAVGFAGIIPLFLFPENGNINEDKFNLQLLLSFAVGGLLSDVFLHLLPEAWSTAIESGASPPQAFTDVGLCVLFGIFLFIIVEMIAAQDKLKPIQDNNNSNAKPCLGDNKIEVSGYLNLLANSMDNFAHGLAVAGSFLVSYKTGMLTTIAILIHEIPHEIGDFAILLKSGFTRWDAARAQVYTAGVGLLGAIFTLILGTSDFLCNFQVYILGFTAGGFLNIALVTVLPDLLKENRPTHSAAQIIMLLIGTATMSMVALFC